MKIEINRGEKSKELIIKFPLLFGWTLQHRTLIYRTPNEWVQGYSSRTQAGQYVLFMDYDNLTLRDVENELNFLIKEYRLGSFYIFKLDRPNSFHAVCLDVNPMMHVYKILKNSSCDQAFINAILRMESREWILRLGSKGDREPVKFLKRVYSPNKNKISLAHKKILLLFGVKPHYFKGLKTDNNKKICFVKYNTANRTIK